MNALSPELIREFVIASHFDLAKVEALLAEHPDLLTAQHQWGEDDFEDGLGAAAHVGNRAIAEFFLARGVPSNICVAAMLGDLPAVQAAIDADPAQADARGAHGITVMFHAALSGDPAITDLLLARGAGEGLDHALQGAVMKGHLAMTRWLLDHGATDVNAPNFQGKTPLSVALEGGFAEIADLLRARGAVEA